MGPDIFLIRYVCLAFELIEIKKANEKKKIGFGKGVQRCVGPSSAISLNRNNRGTLSKSLRVRLRHAIMLLHMYYSNADLICFDNVF